MKPADPLACAFRLLGRRARSEAELTAALQRRGFPEPEVQRTISRCRQLGYLDDARFARERASFLLRQGRAVGRRLLQDLRTRGIPEGMAREAAIEAGAEIAEEEVLRDLLARRFPGFSFAQAEDRQRRRVVHFFIRRGFPSDLIMNILNGREAD